MIFHFSIKTWKGLDIVRDETNGTVESRFFLLSMGYKQASFSKTDFNPFDRLILLPSLVMGITFLFSFQNLSLQKYNCSKGLYSIQKKKATLF